MGLFEKIKGDLAKCFDQTKTGIPLERIEEVVFCHTSILETAETEFLINECQQRGINLNIYGIGPISYDLLDKYPGIARDHLGVEVDTGQIVRPDEFVKIYGRNRLAARLNTDFLFREDEIDRVVKGLEYSNLIIVSGRAGVGKTRFSLECCEQFQKMHPEYLVRCVFGRNQDLFTDLRIHFSEPGCFLLLVDDANRISRFDYVIQLLQDQREDQQIRVIATVRDYAVDKLRDATKQFGIGDEVELLPFEDRQIWELAKRECEILNSHYLERIVDISKGNPRLAMMASEIAKRENTLQSIGDVSALYDEYYATIRNDIEEVTFVDNLKAAGIVTFFRAIDRSDKPTMDMIESVFGIPANVFRHSVRVLHEMEIFDIYEDEIVKVSDQFLATYLFYLAFFRERVLEFSDILDHFFPDHRHRLVDAVYPVTERLRSQNG